MLFKQSLSVVALVASLASVSMPSQAGVDIAVKIAPPALRVETMPAPRVGYVWAPGYWDWRVNKHVWVVGNWQRERPGYVYVRPAWVQRDGQWHLQRGQWGRGDKDNDGVKNVYDRDRDGDHIRNARDKHPNVPKQ